MIFTVSPFFCQTDSQSTEECACDPPLPLILATVGSKSIQQSDLGAETIRSIRNLRQEVVDARKKELDLLINSRLLELETSRLGLTTKQLLDREVYAKAKEPSAAEVRDFYEKNAAQLGGTLESVREQIFAHLRQQNQHHAAQALSDQLRMTHDVRKMVEWAPPPLSAADRQRVLATVAGKPIRSSDVEDSLKALIHSVQKSLYEVRKNDVDLKINDMLLDAEAKKQGLTRDEVLDREVTRKLPKISTDDAAAFYAENKARINGSFEDVKQSILDYLVEQNKNKAMTAFVERLRSAVTIKYAFGPPLPPEK